jgi:hypothetical protein
VDELARKGDNPDINELDFTEMEPGDNSAEFTKSELRQRIDKTTSLLGLNFPITGKKEYKELEDAMSDLDMKSVSSKSLESALFELKSPNSAVDYSAKLKQLTILQRRRKFNKLASISSKYGAKTGISVVVNESGVNTKIGGGMNEDDISEIEKYIETKDRLEGGGNGEEERDEYALDDKSYSSSISSSSSLLVKDSFLSPMKKGSENMVSSVEKYNSSGKRTQAIRKSCEKYDSYKELESTFKSMNDKSASPIMSPEYKEHINALKMKRTKFLARTTVQQLNEKFAATAALTLTSEPPSPKTLNRTSSSISSFE